ncbi:uncharacterized protein LOC141628848 [Silene latifolia]|uniref:uncharacterized protein LOC141628848 n=1 Tax=Silene latifolia TaxID=37657 RepID=UPI003D77CB70
MQLPDIIFKFHLLCKQMRLTNLMFADDVLMFSNGDATSMMLLLPSFSTFSKTSGLKVSASKTNAYFNGVPEELKRTPLVAWSTICSPKEEGGLGIKDQKIWNKVMVGRLVDWVATKKDSIWVQWVNVNYLKGRDWKDYTASPNSSSVWRRICRVKQELSVGYSYGKWTVQPEGYTPAGCYEWLRGSLPKVDWYGVVWNNWNLPKHRFMGWLLAQNSLHTNSRLLEFGMDIDDSCYLCGLAYETQPHLFFECLYSKQCADRPGSKVQKGVQTAMVMGDHIAAMAAAEQMQS